MFAVEGDLVLYYNNCTVTKNMSKLFDDTSAPASTITTPKSKTLQWIIVGAVIIAVAGLGIGLLLYNRKKAKDATSKDGDTKDTEKLEKESDDLGSASKSAATKSHTVSTEVAAMSRRIGQLEIAIDQIVAYIKQQPTMQQPSYRQPPQQPAPPAMFSTPQPPMPPTVSQPMPPVMPPVMQPTTQVISSDPITEQVPATGAPRSAGRGAPTNQPVFQSINASKYDKETDGGAPTDPYG